MTPAKRIIGRVRRGLAAHLLGPSRRLCVSPRRDRAARVLLVARYDPWGLGTIIDHVGALANQSRLRVDVLNLFFCPGPGGRFQIPAAIRLADYQALVIHPTVSYNPENLGSLDSHRPEKLRDYRGVKVLLKQDEHYRTGRVLDHIATTNYDVLATCLEPGEAERVYCPERLRGLRLIHVLTGYVTDDMLGLCYPPLPERPIDVGYRGSLQPWQFGRLAYEKEQIGRRFLAEGAPYGLRMDISSRWEDRHFGRSWYNFLGRCKATLGVESGANVIDFDGEAERKTTIYLATHPSATFDELEKDVLAPYSDRISYRALSPRHFEAAACRTVQVLYEGRYQGIFQPWQHYIPLRRDFANLDDVVRFLRDPSAIQPIVERAFAEIAAHSAYRYQTFVTAIDDAIEEALEHR